MRTYYVKKGIRGKSATHFLHPSRHEGGAPPGQKPPFVPDRIPFCLSGSRDMKNKIRIVNG